MALRIVEEAGRTRRWPPAADERGLASSSRPPLFAVADGMGGARAGRGGVADRGGRVRPRSARRRRAPRSSSRAIVRAANRKIYELAQSDESHARHGHDRDGRAGGRRRGRARPRRRQPRLPLPRRRARAAHAATTRWWRSSMRMGKLTPEDAEHHPQRSIITRALGPEPDVEVDTYTLAGRDGDVFLICSDGLTGMISDERGGRDPARRARRSSEAAEALVAERERRAAARTTSPWCCSGSATRATRRRPRRSRTRSRAPSTPPSAGTAEPWIAARRHGRDAGREAGRTSRGPQPQPQSQPPPPRTAPSRAAPRSRAAPHAAAAPRALGARGGRR